ncbi:MAG: M48 family metallopeptidase [Saprospiraceae bacterium]|uniref:M48 family metallopeptidase n=1 Tax=Candidatus Opimibacter skivensis TaxID=2982028 RepID=A0A9D7SVN0_9BACT|nr:M48 family metallopeptidase [Candidatus Opimibacter skivensis]
MEKLFLKLFIIVAIFFATLWCLRQVDWMTLFNVKKISQSTEEKLGELYWDIYRKMEHETEDKKITVPIDSLLTRICMKNEIDRAKVKLHIIRKDDINAFALPDHHLVLFTGLIEDCENEAELCGVIAHEMAHMENGHIMKKLIKEVGLSILISMTSGNASQDIAQNAIKVLSSTAYDRNLESDADITGADYLMKADIDPEAFAGFLYRMSSREKDYPKQLFWISTHPGSEERTKAIINYISDKNYQKKMVLDSTQWAQLLLSVKED